MKSYFQLYTDDTSTASQIYDSLLYVRGTNAGSLIKNQENDDDVSTVETYDTYMPVRFYNVKSKSDGTTPAGPTHTFYSVYNRAEYNGPDSQNMYDLYADYNIAKLSGAGYITNSIGGAYNYGYDAGTGDDQTIPGVYGVINYARVQPTGSNRTVSYNIGARNWVDINKSDLTATYVYPTISEFAHRTGTVGTLAMHKFDLDYTEGNITNAYFIWADESTLPTPSGEKYFIKSNIPWPTLLSGSLTNTGAVTFNSTLSVSGTATLSSNVNIGGNLVVTGTSTFNGGTITIGDAASDNVVFGADVDSHIIPDDDNTYDLGSSTQEWRNLYVDGTAYVDAISMGGDINLGDNQYIYLGDSNDLQLYHDGTHSYVQNTQNEGDLIIQNGGNDKDVIFKCDDGSGGLTEYFKLDGQYTLNKFSKNVRFIDTVKANFGDSDDLQIYHSSGTNIIDSTVGDLIVKVSQDDGDMIFQSDNGSGAIATYFRLDGGQTRTEFELGTQHLDNIIANFGSSSDLKIYHNGTDSFIQNGTGDLDIINSQDDGDITFQSDDGSGGTTTYFKCKGDETVTQFVQNTNHQDNAKATFGTSLDLQIYHSSTTADSYIQNTGGSNNLIIQQDNNDKAIEFWCDSGSGGITRYMQMAHVGTIPHVRLSDNIRLTFGNGNDLKIYHDSTNSNIVNETGNILFTQNADDGDIVFYSDDGSGGVAEYLRLDGGDTRIKIPDNIITTFGDGGDLQLSHDATNSLIRNYTGDLFIDTYQDDGDIKFRSDDGSGSVTEYFRVDGGNEHVVYSKPTIFSDNVKLKFGDGIDLEIYHDASNNYIYNNTGDLFITSTTDDGDIVFTCDNGSGGTAEYFRLDGGDAITRVARNFRANDNVALQVGVDGDAGMYHDGTNTYIQNDTGDLYIRNNSDDKDIIFQTDNGAGSTITYFMCDGSLASTGFTTTLWGDQMQIALGDDRDLRLWHQSSNNYIAAYTGDLYIKNETNDGDVIFQNDNGSGGLSNYIVLDGGDVSTKIETIKVLMPNLPTSDPGVAGQLWNSSGDLKISAG